MIQSKTGQLTKLIQKNPLLKIGSTALVSVGLIATFVLGVNAAHADDKQVLWGDTHLHTSRSFDAFMFGNHNTTPDSAYRFAKGQPVLEPMSGTRVQISRPLDFLVVADHAELLDVPKLLLQGDKALTAKPIGKKFGDMLRSGQGGEAFKMILTGANTGDTEIMAALSNETLRKGSWFEVVDAADKHNQPGVFTAFSGWEWSSIPDAANLHRVVFTPSGGDKAKSFVPYSSLDSIKPEDLWAWLDKTSAETGVDFVAIPHNSNVSKGKMFDDVDSNGRPLTVKYARTRAKWEPVVEVSQIKGDSETHPILSPDDEFADFETFKFLLDARDPNGTPSTKTKGDYVRSALRRGLELDKKLGVNPYKLGMIGSTDAHTGFASVEENAFLGKQAHDSRLVDKVKPFLGTPFIKAWDMSASGMAAVWAEENTREAITAAFKRKEVYATTGSRIMLRMFGGFSFKKGDEKAEHIAELGYQKGVPMGSDLSHAAVGQKPSFIVQAVKDPLSANLDRIQIVKGWLDKSGISHETIYNVAWSGNRAIDNDGKLPAVGNTVNIKTGKYTNTIGAATLEAHWVDPDFDSKLRAFYYVRVLEIPRPRHSTLDAVALNMDAQKIEQSATIQDRAYSSPIWYTP